MEPPASQNRKPLFSFGMVGLMAMIGALCVAMAVNFRMGNPHYIGGPILFVVTWVLVNLSYRVVVGLFDRRKGRAQP
jgi:heme A synthase